MFNALGAKIRGRSKLPRNEKIICFSPHPDDDVISMGGILYKLAQNGNDITVAYMTSGNLAVFDHDVRRHIDFLRRLAREHRSPASRWQGSGVGSMNFSRGSSRATWTSRKCRTSSG